MGFFEYLRVACPHIKSLAISLYDRSLTREEYIALLRRFPSLSKFGAVSRNLASPVVSLRVLDQYANHLTSLEIHVTGNEATHLKTTAKGLHGFLCAAPLLLHLKAKALGYSSYKYMDIAGRRKSSTGTWTCRNTQTLHLSFREQEETLNEAWSEVNSRVLFGYISRVCPRLRDLCIRRRGISLSLEGGLCLLTRCDQLERLAIETEGMGGEASSMTVNGRYEFRPAVVDVSWIEDWIRDNPDLFERWRRQWRQWSLAKKVRAHGHSAFKRLDDICERCAMDRIRFLNGDIGIDVEGVLDESTARTPSARESYASTDDFEALRRVGELQEVVAWMDEGPGFCSGSFQCWPNLRSFTIAIQIDFSNQTVIQWSDKNVVREHRPEIGF